MLAYFNICVIVSENRGFTLISYTNFLKITNNLRSTATSYTQFRTMLLEKEKRHWYVLKSLQH